MPLDRSSTTPVLGEDWRGSSNASPSAAPRGANTEAEPSAAQDFLRRVAEVDWPHEDLNYLAVNTLYPHGATSRDVRREGAKAILTLQAILADARALRAATASPAIGPSHRLEAICPSPSGEKGEKASRADRGGERLVAPTSDAEPSALELLQEVRDACLYAEDDGQIGVTSEPYVVGDCCRCNETVAVER